MGRKSNADKGKARGSKTMVIGVPTYYKRKDGRWTAEVKIKSGYDIKRKYFYGKQKGEVVLKMNDFLQSPEIVKVSEGVLLSTYAEKWLKSRRNNLKPTSFDRLEHVVHNHINRFLGDYEINKIDNFDISKAISTYQDEGHSFSSVNKFYGCLNSIFTHAVQTETIRKSPIIKEDHKPNKNKLEAERETKPKERIFSKEELERFKIACFSQYKNGNYRCSLRWAFQFMLNTGIRLGEMIALTYGDIDLNKKTVYINKNVVWIRNRDKDGKHIKGMHPQLQYTTKGGRDRVVPLNEKAIEAVLEMKKTTYKDDTSLLIHSKKGGYANPNECDQRFYKVLEKANIEKVGLHTLRHQFCSTLFEAGVNVKRISKILGHKDVSTTVNIYTHIIKGLEDEEELKICV